jgi:ketosteroid isomerase-like protein
MYRRFVTHKVRATFAQLAAGNGDALLAGLADRFTYTFYGDSALSGRRTTRESMRAWWQRSQRLLGGTEFDIEEIIVAGTPRTTRVATRVQVRATLADGSTYCNLFMQTITMRWGRAVEIHTLEDTANLQHALDRLAAAGVTEAHAQPIIDERPAAAGESAENLGGHGGSAEQSQAN